MTRVFVGLVGAAVLAVASPALAVTGTPLANAYIEYTTQAGDDGPTGLLVDGNANPSQTTRTYPVTYSQTSSATSGSNGISSSISDVRNISFQIRATAEADPASGGRSFASAETNLIFQMEINGPPGEEVQIDMSALFDSEGQSDPAHELGIFGQATGFAQIEISEAHGDADYFIYDICPFEGCTTTIDQHYSTVLTLPTDTVFEVDEAVFAQAAVLPTGSSLSSSVSADPGFGIPQRTLNAYPGLTLSFSPNFVPEPQSWVLMLAGVGLAGALLRRRAWMARSA